MANYESFDQRFTEAVQPVLSTYCYTCHSGDQPASMLDLTSYGTTDDVVSSFGVWEHVRTRIEDHEMPPQGQRQPTDGERRTVLDYIDDLVDYEAARNAGDPGIVLARRLSNAELNYTIQDLTGADLQPAREFPVDPANAAGFDNSGETLALSPALLTRQLDAARRVSDHIVFKPRGFDFAPYEVLTDTDRDRYAVRRIIDFYERQPMDLADYFFALWKFENRAALGQPDATLAQVASRDGVSSRYLGIIRDLLRDREAAFGPVAELQERWEDLLRSNDELADVRAASEDLRDFVVDARRKLAWEFEVERAPPLNRGSQSLMMQHNRRQAAHRRELNPHVLVPADQATSETDPHLVIPAEESAKADAIAALARFSDVVPDAFVVSERTSLSAPNATGRLLSAGYHSSMGYFRDDGPLYDLILDDAGREELDALWLELDFISDAPSRQLLGFIWFERTDSSFLRSEEFNHIRAEDRDMATPEKFNDLRELYLAKIVASGLDEEIQDAVALFFDELGAAIRAVEQARLDAQPYHVESLLDFTERAYRRPLSQSERDELVGFYHELRTDRGLSHEDAIRDAVVSVLVSPHFSYRVDLAHDRVEKGTFSAAPLTDYALASRLSYFLWSSMPDAELLAHAEAGDLHQPEVLRAQARRMLRDDRASRLAVEFGTNWLGVRRFEEFNSVSRDRFPTFTNELRQAFFEEPIRFFTDLIREDGSVLDLIFADHTFVNPLLAAHYGMPEPDVNGEEWVRVERAGEYGRGGLLPMAVFLTHSSPGLRTSPVKRGHWLASRVLGQHIPAPPPNVPELPADEADLGDLTLREALAEHRDNPACASCHASFDHFGLVFEGFGPVGEWRQEDLGGRPVETVADFPDGTERAGPEGLREYLRAERQDDFVDNLSRRLLTYALGRGLLLSDDLLIRDMKDALGTNDYRVSSMVETVVSSPQFLMKRVPD